MTVKARLLALIATLIAPLALSACDFRKQGEGNTLTFQYDTDGSLLPTSFRTPIAVGLDAPILVYYHDPAGLKPATIERATTDDTATISIHQREGHTLRLSAHRPGEATLDIRTLQGDDRITLQAREPDQLTLSPPGFIVPGSRDFRLLQHGEAHLGYHLTDSQDRPLIGMGALPLKGEGLSHELPPTTNPQYLQLIPHETGTLTLSPDGLRGASLTLEVIDSDALSHLAFDPPLPSPDSPLDLDAPFYSALIARDDNHLPVFGVASRATLETTDPTQCTLSPSHLGDGAFQVTAHQPGPCTISATLDALTLQGELTFQAPSD